MRRTDTADAMPGRTGPPWTADGTVYFYVGWLSNFAPTPGLRLPFGYHEHRENDRGPCPASSISFRRARQHHAWSST